MPIYEYICCDCGHRFEWLVRGDEQPACPSCGRGQLARQLSVPAAHTARGSLPACPVKDAGACDVRSCCGPSCGFGWQ
ncbi:MAG: FmdB family zinc ribbon protein [Thermoguttaceae bacterium]